MWHVVSSAGLYTVVDPGGVRWIRTAPLTCPGATGVAQTTPCVTAFINQISDQLTNAIHSTMHVENVDHICIPKYGQQTANIAGHIHTSCILNLYAIFPIYVNTDNTDPTPSITRIPPHQILDPPLVQYKCSQWRHQLWGTGARAPPGACATCNFYLARL